MLNKVDIFQHPSGNHYNIPKEIATEGGRNYIVEERLGYGGNAVVYRCTDKFSNDDYAIKFLMNYKDSKRKVRFVHESNYLKLCAHNHIVAHVDCGSVKGSWLRKSSKRHYEKNISFLIIAYSELGDLRKHLNSKSKVEPEIYMAQFRGLSEALAHMHSKNILHRDIKPENVLIMGDKWCLSDFGLATSSEKANRIDITGDKEKVGPMFWMSPEATNKCLGSNASHSKINKCSDVFQLASVFWFIVNKKHPSGILGEKDWKGKKEIYQVLNKALQHNPKNRFIDGREFSEALINAIEQN